MNIRMASLGMVAALMASSAALADARVSVDINPFGWGAPPPVVYEPPRYYESPRYYAPPPVVYYGRGHWGDHREGRGREQGHYREHRDHDGDRRR